MMPANYVIMIFGVEVKIKEKAIEIKNGHSVCLTIDHWTSNANLNNTGMTAHGIGSSCEFHSLELGIFLHEGGSTSFQLEKSIIVPYAGASINNDSGCILTCCRGLTYCPHICRQAYHTEFQSSVVYIEAHECTLCMPS